MEISAALVKQLRDRTGAPMMHCKNVLVEAKGDIAQAEILLRQKGLAGARQKAARVTKEGAVGAYIHAGGKIGVLVEIDCESDFVARTPEFQKLLHDIAMHIAAADPRYLDRDEVPEEVRERERSIYRAQIEGQNKPPAVAEKIITGRLEKFYEEVCLLDQHFIKDDKLTVRELVAGKVTQFGENVSLRRFTRFKVGDNSAA